MEQLALTVNDILKSLMVFAPLAAALYAIFTVAVFTGIVIVFTIVIRSFMRMRKDRDKYFK